MSYRDPDSGLTFPSYEEYERERGGFYDQPEPTEEELCDHSYAGDDGDEGRCHCGARLFPKGGPAASQVEK